MKSLAKDKKIHGESNVWSSPKIEKNPMNLMLDLNRAKDQLAMAIYVANCHVRRRGNDHMLKKGWPYVQEGGWLCSVENAEWSYLWKCTKSLKLKVKEEREKTK